MTRALLRYREFNCKKKIIILNRITTYSCNNVQHNLNNITVFWLFVLFRSNCNTSVTLQIKSVTTPPEIERVERLSVNPITTNIGSKDQTALTCLPAGLRGKQSEEEEHFKLN